MASFPYGDFFWLFWSPLLSMFILKLELEVSGLHEGANRVIALVRAQGIDREEHVLDVLNRVPQHVHRGACHGAGSALALIQFWSGLLEDVAGGALEDMKDDFGMAVKVVVELLPLEDVIKGSP